MKAENLKLNELVSFSEGSLSLKGRRLVLHDLRAMAQFRKDLLGMVGPEQARRILTRFGYFWGQADAAAMKRVFDWDNVEEWLKAGPRLLTLQGLARTAVSVMELDEASGHFIMELTWHNSGEAEVNVAEFGQSQDTVCWTLVGYASGYASFCLKRNIYFLENSCGGKGDIVCWAVGKDRDSWGTEIEPHLPFFQGDDIRGKIERLTIEVKQKQRELEGHRRRLGLSPQVARFPLIEVRSHSFQRVLDLAARIAPFDSSVLITGETGVGKEVLARYIHKLSHRGEGPFLAINCGALPETLLEGELFGHKAGAFTGAIADRVGLFEQAQKGTIFLDEIGDVTPAVQMKLLRVLQEKEIMRVGESTTRKIDVRVLAATNRNMAQAVSEGKFREDLYYRLRVIEIEVPPLRERKEDIAALTRHFVRQFAKKLHLPGLRLDATCLDYLQAYPWPGNVRELENAIERAAVLSRDGVILPEYLPRPVVAMVAPGARAVNPLRRTLDEVEQDHIRAVLELTHGNKSQAAKMLGISAPTLWRKLKQRSP